MTYDEESFVLDTPKELQEKIRDMPVSKVQGGYQWFDTQ